MAEKRYSYFFTRQDISPEQQIVQTSHAAFILGNACSGLNLNPETVHFVVVGVRNQDALMAVRDILRAFEFEYEMFFEPDLGRGEYTSIGVYPIPEKEKGVLQAFSLLKISDTRVK